MKGLFAPSCQSANFNPLSNFSADEYAAFYAKLAGSLHGISRDDASLLASAGIVHICEQSEKGKFNYLDPEANLEAFCFTVAFRKAIDELKQSYTRSIPVVQKDISDVFKGFDLEDDTEDLSEELEQVKSIVSSLKGKGARVLKLWLSDNSDKEIAETMGITLNNVRKSRHEYKDKVVKEMHARGYGRRSGSIKAKESAESGDFVDSFVISAQVFLCCHDFYFAA